MAITIYKQPVHLVAFCSIVLLLSGVFPVFADTGTASPQAQFIQTMGDAALSSLTGKNVSRAVREQRVRQLLEEKFDIQAIGRFAMGPYWNDASDAQRKEYMALFENRIVKVYAARFEDYSGQVLKVGATIPVDEKNSIVSSQVLQKDGPPINLEWRVRSKDGTLKIMDVVVEGVSMSVTQRADFSAVIQHLGGSIDAFLTSLRDQNAPVIASNQKN